MASKCRQNYHEDLEALVNQQINIELNAHNKYLAMVAFYDRDELALKGFNKLFQEMGAKAYEHAHKLIDYQNVRGGRVVLSDIGRPPEQEWKSPLVVIECALNLEKKVNQSLLDLEKMASERSDTHLSDFLKKEFIKEQVKALNRLAVHHTNLHRVGDGLGIFIYDKHLLS